MKTSSTFQQGFASPVVAIMIALFFILPAMIVTTNQSNSDFFFARSRTARLKEQIGFFAGATVSVLRPSGLCSHNMMIFGGTLVGSDVNQVSGVNFWPHLPSVAVGGPPLRQEDFTARESLGFLLNDVQLRSSTLEYVSTRSATTSLMKMRMTFGLSGSDATLLSNSFSKTEEITMLVETDPSGRIQGNCMFTNAVDSTGTLLEDRVCQILKGPNTEFEMKNSSCVTRGNAYGTVASTK